MKKLFLVFPLLLILLIPLTVEAAEFRSDKNGTETVTKTTDKNLYVAAQDVILNTTVSKDFISAGKEVTIDGSVGDDLFIVGQNVRVAGNVGGSARVAGSNVTLDSQVAEDFLAAASSLTLTDKSKVVGDVVVAGENVALLGIISGDVKVTAKNLTIGKDAVINGKISYWSQNEAIVEPGAKLDSSIDFHKTAALSNDGVKAGFPFWQSLIYKLIAGVIALLILAYLLPKLTRTAVLESIDNFGVTLLWGLIAAIVVPVIFIIMLALVLTVKLAFVLAALYAAYLLLAGILLPLIAGVWLWKLTSKEKEVRVDWLTILIGVAVAIVISQIKIVGPMMIFILFLTSLGALIRLTFKTAK
jgi:cytoskeletal protein CcmA (bactofilin family)